MNVLYIYIYIERERYRDIMCVIIQIIATLGKAR